MTMDEALKAQTLETWHINKRSRGVHGSGFGEFLLTRRGIAPHLSRAGRPLCACSPALPPPPSTDALFLAAAVLERSDRLYSSVGEGSTPPEVFAWRVIAVSGDADELFRTVLHRGSR
jgi:hypothetical protein